MKRARSLHLEKQVPPPKEKKLSSRWELTWRIVACAAAYLIVVGFFLYDLRSGQVALAAGDIARETVKASREVEDSITTETRRQEAMNAVGKVFVRDDAIPQQVQSDLEECYKLIDDMRTLSQQDYANWETSKKLDDTVGPYDYSQSLLEQCKKVLPYLSESDLRTMLTASQNQLSKLYEDINTQMSAVMVNDINENAVAQQITTVAEALKASGNVYSNELLTMAGSIVSQFMRANTVYSEELTEVARTKAADGVEAVVYKVGQNIVREGETVTEAQIAVLEKLGLLQQSGHVMFRRAVGLALISALLLLAMWMYLFFFEQETFSSLRKVLLINIVLVITLVACWLTKQLNYYLVPAALGAMLLAVLLEHRLAVVCNFALAGLVGLLAVVGQNGDFTGEAFQVSLAALVGGCAAIYVVYRNPQRTTVLISGLAAGAVSMLVFAGVDMVALASWDVLVRDGMMGLMSGLLSAVICLGTLPVWEWAFQVVTPMKLLEISNPNHPLLKRLLVEASGTYHHSIVVGNLAESAAQAIGANALLTRTGAYYHDVGKLKRPYFFSENQGNENPHDHIEPLLSAKIISAHPTDGYELAKEYKVPAPILNIIREHHGDGKIAYFYYKAQQQAGEGETVDEKDYRYPGPLPHTREAALIMLADTVEAAVRSMKERTPEKIDEMITKLVHAKLDEGQLRHCALTLSDLDVICASFRAVLGGVYHERVRYPNQKL
ncbi:MAG: HDIG domain-containing protein [Eubacteriales bacterium]|nr:HDIG domain-containing protein [Eubacteriales bacterium]